MAGNDLKRKIKDLEQQVDYLQQIIEHIPTHVYWKNKQGVYQGCNKAQAKTLGLKSSDEIIGKTTAQLLGPGIASHHEKLDKAIMRENREERVEEASLDSEKKPATYLSIKAPLYNKKQKVSGLLGVSIDITKIKEAEKALLEAKEKAEEISQMKSEFIHNMEHDIRTPFAGIYGMSDVLARQETDPDKKEALALIAESSKELLEYANHILAFAQIEEEFNKIISKSFSINTVVKSVISMERPAAKNKGLVIDYTLAKNIPEAVVGDPGRLKGILINLASNAIKFTNQGSVEINVKLLNKQKDNVIISFSVKDTGIGIPKDKQKSIYEKFFRVNASNRGIYKGFGLGLQVVKKFVEELNGELSLESSEGSGSIFTFTLPFKLKAKTLP